MFLTEAMFKWKRERASIASTSPDLKLPYPDKVATKQFLPAYKVPKFQSSTVAKGILGNRWLASYIPWDLLQTTQSCVLESSQSLLQIVHIPGTQVSSWDLFKIRITWSPPSTPNSFVLKQSTLYLSRVERDSTQVSTWISMSKSSWVSSWLQWFGQPRSSSKLLPPWCGQWVLSLRYKSFLSLLKQVDGSIKMNERVSEEDSKAKSNQYSARPLFKKDASSAAMRMVYRLDPRVRKRLPTGWTTSRI